MAMDSIQSISGDKKRPRSINFKMEEVDLLIELISDRKKVIENKKSDTVTWKEKQNVWEEIAATMSATTGVARDSKSLRTKYEFLKKTVRKKCADMKQEKLKTGGGPCSEIQLTPIEEKIKALIILSVDGMRSICDSDAVNNFLSEISLAPADVGANMSLTEQTSASAGASSE
ncbi:myb/SANT-like DNA-binding domain-containing protein 3 [Onthophagus taurus]|uniref:myb/SANT-like DNA-binding domain-containing protein 3 n=1 Tax=Onthophagus taurus TaxID=166361 RepID=UPI0039BE6E80